jgi:hypothetical protein
MVLQHRLCYERSSSRPQENAGSHFDHWFGAVVQIFAYCARGGEFDPRTVQTFVFINCLFVLFWILCIVTFFKRNSTYDNINKQRKPSMITKIVKIAFKLHYKLQHFLKSFLEYFSEMRYNVLPCRCRYVCIYEKKYINMYIYQLFRIHNKSCERLHWSKSVVGKHF